MDMKKANAWHNDLHSWHNDVEDVGFKAKYVTLWLALTDTNSSVEFLLGSPRAKHSCARLGKYTTMVDQDCMTNDFARNLSAVRPEFGLRAFEVSSGDAILFHGKVWHR